MTGTRSEILTGLSNRTSLVAVAALALLAACTEPQLILTGERLDLRADTDTAAQDDATSVSRAIDLPGQTANAAWTHKAGSATHSLTHPALGTGLTRVWSASIGQGNDRRHRISADPVIADGRIFTVDSRASVSAHSTSGALLWTADLTPAGESPDAASGAGLAIAGNRLFVSTGFGDLIALDAATGNRIWVQELNASAAGAPTVVGDLVYLVTRDALAWAVNVDDGRVAWTLPGTPSSSGVVGGAAPVVNDRLAIFPFANGELVAALREGGTRIWSSHVAGQRRGRVYARISDISGDPVIHGDRIYAGSPAGRTVAIDLSSGDTIWNAREGAMSPVVVAGGSVFTVSDQAELVRLDAETGSRIWGTELSFFVNETAKKRKAVYSNFGPLLAGGQLFVASSDGSLRAFDPESGVQSGTAPLPGGAASNPVVAGRTLYVVSGDGQLHAFR